MISLYDLIKHKYEPNREQERPLIRHPPPSSPTSSAEINHVPDNVALQEPENKFNASALVLLIILYIIPVCLIVYGCVHLHDCPAQNMIAISFLVLGGVSFLSRILSCPYECRNLFQRDQDIPKNIYLLCLNFICQMVIIGFFIAICSWIFSIKPDTDPKQHDSPNYCELQFYRDTYWGCVVGLVMFGLIFIVTCCAVCCLCCSAIYAALNEDDD